MAKWDQAGVEVPFEDVYFPYFIRFKPVRTTTTDDSGNTTTVPPITNADSPFFQQLDGSAIPAETTLFEVWALESPPSCTPRRTCTAPLVDDTGLEEKIGEIKTTTEFTQSLWGDERLFFQHGKFINDWDSEIGGSNASFRNKALVKFNQDTWGGYPIDDFNVPDTSDDEVVQGMMDGCPFKWAYEALEAFELF